MRDVCLGALPLSWVTDPTPVIVCIAVAFVACLLNERLIGRRMDWLLYADAAGMALFAVLGATSASEAGAHPLVAILFGAMSASFGGILRDVICNQTPLLLKNEIYISAAALSASIIVLVPAIGPEQLRVSLAIGAGFLIRVFAIRRQWRLGFPKPIVR